MSTEKDKRASKLFGTRITSIFNQRSQQLHHNEDSSTASPFNGVTTRSLDNSKRPLDKPALVSSSFQVSKVTPSTESSNFKTSTLISSSEIKPSKSKEETKLRRKPPPSMVDEPTLSDNLDNTEVKQGNIKDDLSDIITSLENEIDTFLLKDTQLSDKFLNDQYAHGSNDNNHLTSPKHASSYPGSIVPSKSNPDYSDSASMSSQSKKRSCDSPSASFQAPYPIDSSVVPSPIDDTFNHSIILGPHNTESIFNKSLLNNRSQESLSTSRSQITGGCVSPQKSVDTFESNQSTPYQGKVISSPRAVSSSANSNGSFGSRTAPILSFVRSTTASSLQTTTRNPLRPIYAASLDSVATNSSSELTSRSKSSSIYPVANHHRKSSSVGSIWSSKSYRNINLATLKKTLNLKPGEGDRSNYVLTIRRNSGTAYNESAPGKWKLPTGILPIDKAANSVNSNGRYIRLAGGVSHGRSKKASGVELKHGHLQPRLLAAEVDDANDNTIGMDSVLGGSCPLPSSKTNESSSSSIAAPSTSINNSISRNNSLKRTVTDGSLVTDMHSITTTGADSASTNPSLRRTESGSSSSGSISDSNVEIGLYYQHPGYACDGDDDDSNPIGVEADGLTQQHTLRDEEFDEYQERPRLFLANPDTSSDSD